MNELSPASEASIKRDLIVEEALKWLETPSVLYSSPDVGITPQGGFDCSGFVKFILEKTGVELPPEIRHTSEFFDSFGVLVHLGLQKRGDLVFFSRSGASPTHMGIVTSETQYIHAPGTTNSYVEISELIQKPIDNPSISALYNVNPIGFKRYTIPNGRWKII
ncbi:MAG: hypothetical protein COU25_01730 [Candidatus Levybacteria bacterium CG10_big_fil_rev_8_21_14_0_10_35_13]|nr:MAG: hypothetical protein COU25_01730 [Candidatus Levybacteria bacterium CG10_big_fil_rev_8_21_14_0_10_35_13]